MKGYVIVNTSKHYNKGSNNPKGGSTMTRKELIKAVADHTRLTQNDVERVIYATFDVVILKELVEGREVSINNFGKLEPVTRGPRKGRNPQTGEAIDIEERSTVKFRPSGVLKEKLN